jgi:hypothetical protein
MTQDLVDAAGTLAEVLTRENAALRRLDFVAAVALGQTKETALLGMTKDRIAAPVTDRDPALLALGRRINGLVVENRALLERAIAVQIRIVGIIVRAAPPSPALGQYVASGFRSLPRRASAMALSARA